MITPQRALLAGGCLYACGAVLMTKYYYQKSSFRKIFEGSDPEYRDVKILHHA
ncbi:hypothetical protein METSCH_E00250 [Metschnikowia aff. pulcherrima]|uniref:Uncharacterized protein n=1 Tax=Metschnikowia aff. pulcherrima TaxID=2163413 RepID=A0A4P6XQI8_9ASCO|nr:hypothetical protein METSCH_E00250 [Metschnikowia aff. pulcherrima]